MGVRLLAIGEVMAEIRGAEGGLFRVAGDTYNTAVYAAREMRHPGNVGYVTRIGREPLSKALLVRPAEGLDVGHIAVDDDRNIGIYPSPPTRMASAASYWRSQSAARAFRGRGNSPFHAACRHYPHHAGDPDPGGAIPPVRQAGRMREANGTRSRLIRISGRRCGRIPPSRAPAWTVCGTLPTSPFLRWMTKWPYRALMPNPR